MRKEIEIPYNFKPMPHQLEYLQSDKRFKIMVFHRRAGKSAVALNGQILKLQQVPGLYYYFLPTYRQAKSVVWDSLIRKHVPMELVNKMNDSELTIYWKNGSIQKFAGCEDIDKHRGIDPIDVVFDEYSLIEQKMWTAIVQPIVRRNGGSVSFLFTPNGRNHAWKLMNMALDRKESWFVSVKTVNDTNIFTKEELESAKRETPEALYKQEYECNFNDNAGAFFRRIRENTYQAHTAAADPTHYYQIGVDLAKYKDWTVITPFDLNTFYVLPQERFNQVDWNLQSARIEALARRYNNAKVKIDRTGVGDPIVEELEARGLNIGDDGAVVFTGRTKQDLMRNLAMLLEKDKIKIPDDDGLIAELESFQYQIDPNTGKLKFEVLDGMTDDRVMSLALAVHDCTNKLSSTTADEDSPWRVPKEDDGKFDKFSLF